MVLSRKSVLAVCLSAIVVFSLSFLSFAQQQRTLEVWINQWSADATKWVQENVVPAFEAKHPGVKVNISPEGSVEKLVLATAGGIAPDIIFTGGTSLIALAPQGLLRPLNSYVEQWDEYEMFHPLAFANAWWEGNLYSIPQTVELRMINYHKDLFNEAGLDPERPPQSWEELEAAARRLTRISGNQLEVRGYLWGWSNINAAQEFGGFLMQNGGKLISDDSRKPLFNDALGLETLEFLFRMYEIAYPPGVAGPQPRAGLSAFSARQVAMLPGAPTIVQQVRDQAPEILGQASAFVPRRSPNHEPVALAFINGLGIPAGAQNPDLAFEFIEMLSTAEASKVFMRTGGFVSPRIDLAEWVQETLPEMVPWYMALEYIRPWPQIPGAVAGYTTLGDEILKVLRRQIPPATALILAEQAQANLFNDYWASIESGR